MQLLNQKSPSIAPTEIDEDSEEESEMDGVSEEAAAAAAASVGSKMWPTHEWLQQWRANAEPRPSLNSRTSTAAVMEEVRDLNLQIFASFPCDEDAEAAIRSTISKIEVDSFYIGATMDPVRRWLGDHPMLPLPRPQPQAAQASHRQLESTREEPMQGHFRQWFAMHLIAVATNQFGNNQARVLESDLIKFPKKTWPCLCKNIAEDARGQCNGLNFIYMVVKDGRW